MPMGNVWATLFFVLLALAAISSTISMHEAVTSYFVEKRGMSRKHGARLVTLIALVLATAASLSLGDWSEYTLAGMNFFSLLDNFTSIVMLPLLGVLTAVFVGWIWKKEDMRAELTAEGGVDLKTYPIIRFLLKWVCTVLVSAVFVFGIIDFVKGQIAEKPAIETPVEEAQEFNLDVRGLEVETPILESEEIELVTITPVTNNTNNN